MHVLLAALAVLLDFLLQVTAFVALIVFDFLRAEDNRIDCFPCFKISRSNVELEKGIISSFPFGYVLHPLAIMLSYFMPII